MESKTITDSTAASNIILKEIIDAERADRILKTELSSQDLFKIDSAILSSLRSTRDFSRDLLKQLENGVFESITVKAPKSIDNELQKIQCQTIVDITTPLNDMFNEMADIVTAELVK